MPWNYVEGMSYGACNAYARGLKPLSRITKEDLEVAGWKESRVFAKWLAQVATVWVPSEWHHSSKYANCVDFYDPLALVEAWEELTENEKRELKKRHKKPTIYEIAERTKETAPHFFTEKTLRFFGQYRKSSGKHEVSLDAFSVTKTYDGSGRWKVSAPSYWEVDGESKRMQDTVWFFDPVTNELKK